MSPARKCLRISYAITMLVLSIIFYLLTGTVFYFVFEGPLFNHSTFV